MLNFNIIKNNMRKQFNKTITDIFLKDKKAVMLLGDIGVLHLDIYLKNILKDFTISVYLNSQ